MREFGLKASRRAISVSVFLGNSVGVFMAN